MAIRYNQKMSLIVVGSVAYDGVETPHGKVDRMLGGAATYISLAASYFTKVGIVAVVGDDFAKEDTDLLTAMAWIWKAWSGFPEDFLLGGQIHARYERSRNADHGPERLRRFQSQAPASYWMRPIC
jgi:hypothetical protein